MWAIKTNKLTLEPQIWQKKNTLQRDQYMSNFVKTWQLGFCLSQGTACTLLTIYESVRKEGEKN